MALTRRIFTAALAGLSLLAAAAMAPRRAAADEPVVVFAAASMKNALDDAAASWRKATGKQARISYAASNTLAKQIEQGAPADIFLSADLDWMDYAAGHNLIRPDTRVNLLANRIVLIAPQGEAKSVALQPGLDFAKLLGGGRLAMGNVDAVPAGRYGKAALEKLGAWDGVKDKIAQAESVRAALLLVSRGEAPYGIVYQTDAAADPGVSIVGTFPEDSHPPIIYPIAITASSKNPDAAAFLSFLRSDAVRPAFEKQDFAVLGAHAQGS